MDDSKGGGETNSNKQHQLTSTSQNLQHQQASAQGYSIPLEQQSSSQLITTCSFLSPPPNSLYTPSPIFDQQQQHFEHLAASATISNTKRPRYTAGQWKLLPHPSLSQKQTTPRHQQITTSTLVLNDDCTTASAAAAATATASSSDTVASSPSLPGQDCTNLEEAGGDQPQQQLHVKKGKIVSSIWKPNEMLWLAKAWRIQYEGGSDQQSQDAAAGGDEGRGTKTRAEKDKEVAEFLKRNGVNRDPKIAGTKWDNMLGDFRRVARWERGGGRDQTRKSYFTLYPVERKIHKLPASFDQEVFNELSQYIGSRTKTPHTTTRPARGVFHDSYSSLVSIDDHELPLSAKGKQLALSRGGEVIYGRGNLLGYDAAGSSEIGAPIKELRRIGKVRMIWEESVSLWAEEGEHHKGRVKAPSLSFLNADEIIYLDDSLLACTMETFENATSLEGFSVDRFVCGQQLKVFGRRKSSSAPPPPPQPSPPAASFTANPPLEFQDPTENYMGSLRIPPSTLPSLVELSWHLQEPPPEDLRFPLRKDVYKDLPQGKELFFNTSNELLDCRAITYDILSPIIRSNPSLTASTSTTRESFIGLWDDCINRLISKFCSLEIIFLRKPSSHSADTIQDQWPNLTAFIGDLCLWRGEETDKLREGYIDPSNSIVEKISWTYGDLPYVLGYYAVGYTVTFCAFSPSHNNGVFRTDLYTLDLSTPAERLKALILCWRIAGLLPLLADRCVNCINNIGNNLKLLPYSDFQRIDSGNGNVIEMKPNTITRYFSNKRKWFAVKEIYEFLDKRIPHSEFIVHVSEKDLALTFKPRGLKFKPINHDQLIEALKYVTKALVALHDLSFMHRDLGWDKVVLMRRSEGDNNNNLQWFVTGFDEAVGAPQIYPYAAANDRHAPEMGRGMHGVKVDMWGVGQLVKRCGLVGIPKILRELQNRCLDPNPEQRPTAADCYHHLLQLQSSMPPAAVYNI